jgi:hypothetical protein
MLPEPTLPEAALAPLVPARPDDEPTNGARRPPADFAAGRSIYPGARAPGPPRPRCRLVVQLLPGVDPHMDQETAAWQP